MNCWVYILECVDRSFYVGKTTNIDRRLREHYAGLTPYTKNRKPIKLVYLQKFGILGEAIRREKEIKGWNRKKKAFLIGVYAEERSDEAGSSSVG